MSAVPCGHSRFAALPRVRHLLGAPRSQGRDAPGLGVGTPAGLGTTGTYSVLGGQTVANTGPSVPLQQRRCQAGHGDHWVPSPASRSATPSGVSITNFHEFIAIDRAHESFHLVIASDD
jgi:hypothetical protein